METGGSTTNLNNHLKTCLKKPRGSTFDSKQSELTFAKFFPERETTFSTWKFDEDAIRKALIHMIIVDELPFRIVEGEGFKLFLSKACPRFHLPSRFTVRKDCLDLFNSMKNLMKNSFGQDTNEEWMLQKRIIKFCPIPAHRGENIGQALEKCIRDWGIERIFTITVDNASANTVGVEYLRKKLNHRNVCVANGKYMHTRCVAHAINLIVQEGVKHASVSVDRVRAAVRWNSTYMMLKVAAKYERAFDSYARDDHSFFLDLSTGDGVPTSEDLDVISITSKMREKYNKYWGDAKKINFLVYFANIFDPRHKMEFVNFGVKLFFPDIAADVMKTIDKELHCLFDEYSSISGRAMVYEGQSSIPTKYLLKKQRVGLENKSELDRYLAEEEEANNSSSFDILLWWKMNSPRYPVLAQMARDVFSIPISTVASESAFSTSGRVLDGFRSSLTPMMVEALICTQDWLRKSKDPINLDEYAAELQNMEDGNI
ncbi:hypothetical protein GQ457_06G016050 [Hibiscus cannabinus]